MKINLSYTKKKKKNPLFLPEHTKHKSHFGLQTRLSTAGKTPVTIPIIKNMIQCLLPIAEQKLGSDPVFCVSLTWLPATLAAWRHQQTEGSALKFDDPLCRTLLVQRSSTSARGAVISSTLLSALQSVFDVQNRSMKQNLAASCKQWKKKTSKWRFKEALQIHTRGAEVTWLGCH